MPGPRRPEQCTRFPSPGDGPAITADLFLVLALLWLAGAAIRIPLLAVPPVIPLIHDDLHMTETQVGLLMGLPLSMFALAATPGSLLIARFGVLRGRDVRACDRGARRRGRAAAVDIWTLYAATLLMGFGVAIFQPAFPTLVRLWAPNRAWLANAVSTNGMLLGATFASALSIPVVLPLLGFSWRLDLLAWSVPGSDRGAALHRRRAALRTAAGPADTPPRQWWPDWHSPQLWLLGIALGANNALFFAVNAFIPDYLSSTGRSEMIGMTLAGSMPRNWSVRSSCWR